MSDEQAFLRAIADDPDADLPRLAYADFLEEHGRPEHAEFVRLRCRAARMPDWHPDIPALELRCRRLWNAHYEDWARGQPPSFRTLADTWPYDVADEIFPRGVGFSEVWYSFLGATRRPGKGESLQAHDAANPLADGLMIEEGWIAEFHARRHMPLPLRFRRLRLFGADRLEDRVPPLGEILDAECFEPLRELHVTCFGTLDRRQAESFAARERFRRLRRLVLHGERITRGAADRLFAGVEFPDLTMLDVEVADAPGLMRALSRGEMPALRDLRLHVGTPGRDPAGAFANWPGRAGLESLDLGYSVNLTTLRGLVGGGLDRLRKLRLVLRLFPDLLGETRSDRPLPSLTNLTLVGGRMPDPGLLPRLQQFTLFNGSLDRAAVKSLAPLADVPGLRSVRLHPADGVTPDGLRALAESPWLGRLVTFGLGDVVGDGGTGAKAFAASPHLGGLRRLILGPAEAPYSGRPRGRHPLAGGLRHLIAAPWVAGLAELDLRHTGVTDRAAARLLELPEMPNLARLSLEGNPVSP